ncbi:L-cysteine desulfidase family protein [Dysosmobacter sp.]|uniref:L-cysteine desulfidase family protein n=1 Tax=Dysosmobacter sp. TaxID=2591382 RepID=UPI002A875E17|nr:L-serine ammonia-lyase, iron-sulfur-dependent, subunit alpha [Dysosmobacter sp.]MDY3282523.1 L-serine ammonia-lyase, iron-sulfur-dependent, subunit alpha [Dysosmobacter sp.]
MERSSLTYQTYVRILERELIPAMGCTEPIAIAYCAAKARAVLGAIPDAIHIDASGNIIKNVKSVVVPNTGGRRGIAVAAAAGALCGDENALLEVISHITEEDKARLPEYLEQTDITVSPAQSDYVLDIVVTVSKNGSHATVRAVNEHTNLVLIEKDGVVLEEKEIAEVVDSDAPDYTLLSIEGILDFAETCDLADVEDILSRQISMNTAISDEGLKNDYGANIGKVLLSSNGNDIRTRAKARAAAGSDARMNGCELPVVINSGSGNQGLTASLPVIEYAKELGSDRETLYRALLISNLVTLHEKTGIGRLSAYCGAVSAGAGAGAGITYLHGGRLKEISHTVVNALAITSGIVCDGAKSSCAAKIAASVDAGILGFEMYRQGQQFYDGDGLVLKGVENTIRNIGRLGKVGMRETDHEIIRMMTQHV